MYTIVTEGHFDSAHFLRNYEGPCANNHGHSWRVQVAIKGDKLESTGILLDFKELKRELNIELDRLDHHCINDLPPFDNINPTAENLSKYLFEALSDSFFSKKEDIWLKWVRVWESATSYSEYTK
jgi:6-pyruvoyltetrahydropterin/6-carboxytetrahydropterin synthase